MKSLVPNFYQNNQNVYKTTAKNAQEAHEAIRPTNLHMIPGQDPKMSPEEIKVYAMIWKRALESQILPAIYDQTAVAIASKKEYEFRASGSVIKFDGWLTVGKFLDITEEDEEIKPLPVFKENELVNLEELLPEQHFTQPPARYSDATLIKKLEELGIGRPSTYAPTIATIQARGYVQKDGRYFVPTDVAYVVNDLLTEHFKGVVDYQFTAELEEDLDEIANGEKEWVPVIREFYEPFAKDVAEKDKVLQKTDVTNLGESGENCPDCGRPLVYKLGKYGKFLSCSGYPECTFAKPVVETIALDGSETAPGEEVKEDYGKCPNCEDGVLKLRMGRFGKFLACSNYPKCKTAKPFLQKIGIHCPKCQEGDVVIKKFRKRFFYGCSRYPDCDFASWKKPTGDPVQDAELLVPKPKRSRKSKEASVEKISE
jgi:DNA topoisomerase I